MLVILYSGSGSLKTVRHDLLELWREGFQNWLRLRQKGVPLAESLHFHDGILSQRILNIKGLEDLHLILCKKVPMVAASLVIKRGEGGPARVITVEGSFRHLLS